MRSTTPSTFTRRHLAMMAVGGVAVAWSRATAEDVGRLPDVGVGVLLEPAGNPSAASEGLGVRFGLAEAAHVVTLMGSRLQVAEVTAERSDRLPRAAVALIVASEGHVAGAAARSRPGVTVLATRPTAIPAGRKCFSVASPENMRQLARRQMSGGAQRIVDWDPRLRRYGAAQLNERYRRHTGRDMDEHAWHGWMACKVAVELALQRVTGSTNVALVDLVFDGHKGRPLTFSPGDHHLIQPVYVVAAEMDTAPIEVRPEGNLP